MGDDGLTFLRILAPHVTAALLANISAYSVLVRPEVESVERNKNVTRYCFAKDLTSKDSCTNCLEVGNSKHLVLIDSRRLEKAWHMYGLEIQSQGHDYACCMTQVIHMYDPGHTYVCSMNTRSYIQSRQNCLRMKEITAAS